MIYYIYENIYYFNFGIELRFCNFKGESLLSPKRNSELSSSGNEDLLV